MTTRTTTESIWSHLSSDLRTFIRRRVADDHSADDLLQETFVRVHRHVGSLQEADRLAAWVYQIARNVVRDHYRQRATAPASGAELAEQEECRDEPQACRPQQWLQELIRSLPDGYREAIQLCEIEGLTQQEVAERLGISHSGAKSRIQHGRAMLKQLLQDCCQLEFDGRGALVDCTPRPSQSSCQDCGR